mmetsp:Transcript_85141/g.245819  ORF Transcript_85141/g.245819 Transcript_85141/m.245819 type:complete len:196 (+) Transcript_85141:85-672(+)
MAHSCARVLVAVAALLTSVTEALREADGHSAEIRRTPFALASLRPAPAREGADALRVAERFFGWRPPRDDPARSAGGSCTRTWVVVSGSGGSRSDFESVCIRDLPNEPSGRPSYDLLLDGYWNGTCVWDARCEGYVCGEYRIRDDRMQAHHGSVWRLERRAQRSMLGLRLPWPRWKRVATLRLPQQPARARVERV